MSAPLFAFLLILMCLAICAVIVGWIALCFWIGERRSWATITIVSTSFALPIVGIYFAILYSVTH